ncbi:hypothetical protein ACRAWG_12390 [Methylobacterium sp. P31]
MGSSDPERRLRQLAILRAAYQACPDSPGTQAGAGVVRHSRTLLGRILVVLGGMPGGGAGQAVRPDGKARPGA